MTEEEVRAAIVAALEADLVGPFDPATGAEILPLPPSRWYLTGFLAPQTGTEPEAQDPDSEGELAAGGETQREDAGDADPEPKQRQRFPASLGLSVFLPARPGGGTADAIEVEISYADYAKEETAADADAAPRVGWKRVPNGPHRVEVPLENALLTRDAGIPVPDSAGLRLRGELQDSHVEGMPSGTRVLSLFLINVREPLDRDRDLHFVFQVQMKLRYARGFLPRPNLQGEAASDDDLRVLALQFHDRAEWAVGHNTSVVRPEPNADGRVRELTTTQLPRHEVRRVAHVAVPELVTDMEALSRLDGGGLVRALTPLVENYGAWIEKQRYTPLESPALGQTRGALMDRAEHARKRIRGGIDLLEHDAEIRSAFQWANVAMRAAALQADRTREDPRYRSGAQPTWHPFQLAFLLLNLAAMADPAHPDRATADLIYFPTGGGKTEAYLGLIAFTLLLRRLRGNTRPDEGRGVAVILRYTLRLLTLDQLGRAATLICALEAMRQRDPARLGNTRFAVGLWVGKSASANRLKEVHAALNDHTGGRESPFPLSTCPWCGASIQLRGIKLVDDSGSPSKTRYTRAVVYCEGESCLYTERKQPGQGLPVLFVDEQIYRELPEFIVGTVDKFAMLPWLGEAGMLFGRATHVDGLRAYGVMHDAPAGARALPEGLVPPELIVQDELHLISGPLGTLVGLYESAVTFLCQRAVGGRVRVPKIICSTATVRRARAQVQALFRREMEVFPPRGIDDGDTFFSAVDPERPGRLYVGVAAPGRALRAVSVRTYATLLAAAQKHFDPSGPPEQPADPYMTLVGYFNSLRELGGMRRLVEDEVRSRVFAFTSGKRPLDTEGPHPWAADRSLLMPAELTSRVDTQPLKKTKQDLAMRRAQPRAPRQDGAQNASRPEPLDTVLASSMISVGLDVDRLGLMVVTGQPKTTSEYIQATSRVGRSYPGLVVTCLNVGRPRDRSHYERFVAYHESFYREVEATSVTPFSLQTLDRGLVGTLLAMIRHGIPELEPPRGFMGLHEQRARAEQILETLIEHGRRHREWYDAGAEETIEHQLRTRGRNFLDAWERVIHRAHEGAAERIYSPFERAKSEGKSVMYMATDDRPHDLDERRFSAPTSMRDVEPETHLWLRFGQLDEGR